MIRWSVHVLTLLVASPLLIGFAINGTEFVVSPGLLVQIILTVIAVNRNQIGLMVILFAIELTRWVMGGHGGVVSAGYYFAVVLSVTSKIELPEDSLTRILDTLIALMLGCILLDLISPLIIDSVISFPRRTELSVSEIVPSAVERLRFTFSRPVGFFRESSEFGMMVSAVYYLWLNSGASKGRGKVAAMVLFSFSFSAYLAVLVITLLDGRFGRRLLIPLSLAAFVVYGERIQAALEMFSTPSIELVSVNTSEVKRIVHPLVGFALIEADASFYKILFGHGAGTYKEQLQIDFSELPFSDLAEGYILNGSLNLILVFGIIGYLLILNTLRAQHTLRHLSIIHLFLLQGLPLLSPIFLVCNLKKKKPLGGNIEELKI
jgi:hypothetical protein